MRRLATRTVVAACVWFAMTAGPLTAADNAKPADNSSPEKKISRPADFGDLQRMSVEFGIESAEGFKLAGRDARQQLVVTGHFAGQRLGDLTHHATYTTEPAGIVEVDAQGLVTPLAEGSATITAQLNGRQTASTRATVTRFAQACNAACFSS